jgi:hypothetical protein
MVARLLTVSEETVAGVSHAELLTKFQTSVKDLKMLETDARVVANKEPCVASVADQERWKE